ERQISADVLNLGGPGPSLQEFDDSRRRRLAPWSAGNGRIVAEAEMDLVAPSGRAPARQVLALIRASHVALEPPDLARQAPLERIEEAAFAQTVGAHQQRQSRCRRQLGLE